MMNGNSVATDLIYLVACAVNQTAPAPDRVQKMDLASVYEFASVHSLAAAAAFALEASGVKDSRYVEAKAKSMRKLVLLDVERRRVLQQLEAHGIWYLPLKGAVLKDDYPAFGMREMADNDILCDPARMSDIKTIMEDLGFTCESYDESNHDTYFKAPFIEFEMHCRLFNEYAPENLLFYYDDVQEKMIRDTANAFGYHLSDEDFYLFLLAHEYKHYHFGGTGLRSLLDVYVFLKKHGETLDFDYLSAELEKLELTEFERLNRRMAQNLFGEGIVDAADAEELRYFLTSGTYGTKDQQRYNHLAKVLGEDDSSAAKAKILHNRFFPDMEALRERYPGFTKHKVYLPFLFVYRVAHGLISHPKSLFDEFRSIRDYHPKKKD